MGAFRAMATSSQKRTAFQDLNKLDRRKYSIQKCVTTTSPARTQTSCRACPFSGTLSIRERDYLPFKASPYKLSMGLSPMSETDWIEEDELYLAEIEERKQLLRDQRDVVLHSLDMPQARAANQELLEMLAAHLPEQYPDRYSLSGSVITNKATGETFDILDPHLDPLETAGLLVQEDFAIVMKVDDGPVQLTSGVVCFPMYWTMQEKIGMRITDIHDPVPFFREQISKFVENFFERLQAGKPFIRANWTVANTPELHIPLAEDVIRQANKGEPTIRDGQVTAAEAGERLYLRVERQAFHKMPKTGACLFTIRTYIRPLSTFQHRPEVAGRLATAVRNLPIEVVRYKSMTSYKDAALEYLDGISAGHGL